MKGKPAHGRIETRTLRATEIDTGIGFPGAVRVLRITRTRTVVSRHRRTRKQTRETVYVVTSLSALDAGHHQIAAWLRGHWRIENSIHFVRRETQIARWLEESGIAAVQVAPGIDQPLEIDGRAVTFWRELPPHHHGTPVQVAAILAQLHHLPPPTEFDLGAVAPFVRLEQRIAAAPILTDDDRHCLREWLSDLQQRWEELPEGLPWCVVHGDAWVGNVAATDDGRVLLLDLERTSIGPPEWDLVHTTIKWRSFGWITEDQYAEFCDVYGYDVTTWNGYELLRDIRELRMTTMAAQMASSRPAFTEQARHRLACIRGERGLRPWPGWAALS